MPAFAEGRALAWRGGVLASLAVADLAHEALLTACLVSAIAAVLAPLLLLLGLKYGTIETLRGRLIEDPVYREIKPARTQELPARFFDEMRARPEVKFIVPSILRGASIIRVVPPRGDSRPVDMLPTASGDPLILENGGVIPGPGEAVLSQEAAQRLGVASGERVTLRISRSRDGRPEAVETPVTVAAVLAPRADAEERIYLPLDLVVDIETYREGLPVPARGWPGGLARPVPVFDGAFVLSARLLDTLTYRSLTINTGFNLLEAVDPARFAAATGLPLPEGMEGHDIKVIERPAEPASLEAVRNKLRGRGAVLLPYVLGVAITLPEHGGAVVPLAGIAPRAEDRAALGLEAPWPAWSLSASFAEIGQILLPAALGIPAGSTVTAAAPTQGGEVRFPLRVVGTSPGETALVPLGLTAVLRSAADRPIAFEPTLGEFMLARTGYRGFRLYTASIEDIPELYRELQQSGLEVSAQVQAIERIGELDRGMTNMFWLVALIGIGGGIAALIASLYASVQRKQRDLSMLRLMGLSRGDVFALPIYQSLIIALLCTGLAMALYFGMAGLINAVFARDLQMGEEICWLPPSHLALAFLLTLGTAAASSLVAAWQTSRIEPAEAIRVE